MNSWPGPFEFKTAAAQRRVVCLCVCACVCARESQFLHRCARAGGALACPHIRRPSSRCAQIGSRGRIALVSLPSRVLEHLDAGQSARERAQPSRRRRRRNGGRRGGMGRGGTEGKRALRRRGVSRSQTPAVMHSPSTSRRSARALTTRRGGSIGAAGRGSAQALDHVGRSSEGSAHASVWPGGRAAGPASCSSSCGPRRPRRARALGAPTVAPPAVAIVPTRPGLRCAASSWRAPLGGGRVARRRRAELLQDPERRRLVAVVVRGVGLVLAHVEPRVPRHGVPFDDRLWK